MATMLYQANTAAVHKVDTARFGQCPPCSGHCEQGDACPARAPHAGTPGKLTEAHLDRAHAWRTTAPGALAARQRGPRRIAVARRLRAQRINAGLLAAAIALTLWALLA